MFSGTLVVRRIRNGWPSRYFSTTKGGESLRIAIVGGGVAGLSSALHLAPLVASGHIEGPIDIFDGGSSSQTGREIGVGIWSTAMDPFVESKEESHQLLIDELEKNGSYLRDVGYRTPKGHWLAKSRLGGSQPDLLFIREMDLLGSLRKALDVEQAKNTIRLLSGPDYKVKSIAEDSPEPWSATLKLGDKSVDSERDYHLVIAADGMNSTIRQKYGGHLCERSRLMGTNALKGPLDLPQHGELVKENWHTTGHVVATETQDREYTVFRGNANVSGMDVDLETSFQTWGEGQSMRFATVPMSYPDPDNPDKREERDVWFITIENKEINSESDPVKRKELLLEEFKGWHEPIGTLVRATPADEILMERALAHRHSMSPLANFNEIVTRILGKAVPSRGNGPAIIFIGDAFMCVDPILAQGFTVGMEGAAALKTCLESSLLSGSDHPYQPLAFDPILLRQELKERHDNRLHRLICLLRATEMVQALGQPMTGTLAGFISRDVIRPLMRLTPGFIKTPIFNAVAKYSLGLPQSFDGNKSRNS
ncbi:unnamed protein product [Cylindrotheca closterium]|uniref:FAD-binding domain-containing protein n=1 Tax=Cylindrotheca closterium TaxID=2856 RepID=A0AAD2FFT1_9STRA|nr:unnamed protein product [Cylindrotheca closterium]